MRRGLWRTFGREVMTWRTFSREVSWNAQTSRREMMVGFESPGCHTDREKW